MRFKYKARKDGKIIEGKIEAESRFEVYKFLKSQNAQLVSLKKDEPGVWNFEYWNMRLSTIPQDKIILFASNLGTMISAGLSLSRALETARKQSANPKLRSVISSLLGAVEKGDSLHGALAKHKGVFSDLFISMVRAGELSGNLPEALHAVALQLERVHMLKKKIKGAMIYPSIIVLAVVAVGIFMMVAVVPSLSATFKEMNVELPYSTQVIIAISDFLKDHSVVALLLFFNIFAALFVFLRSKSGKVFKSSFFLKVPLIKTITRELNSARTARTLSSLLKAGVDIVESMEIASEVVQNVFFKRALGKMAKDIQKGKTVSESLREYENLFPTMFIELVAVGEETGSLVEMMGKVADYYEEEVNAKTKNMSTIVEPFLMLFIGVSVGFFALAMVTPMYSLANSM